MSATSPPSVINLAEVTTRLAPRRWFLAAASWLWFWLRRPWLASLAGIIGVVLALSAWQLPQLPGQLVDEQAAAARWLLNTSATYGIWGNAFLALGLFDLLRSPLLYLLLALLVPTLAAQLAEQLGALRQQRSVYAYPLTTPADAPGLPIAISAARPLFRWRGLVVADPALLADTLQNKVQADFAFTRRAEAPIADDTRSPATEGKEEKDATPPAIETRWVGMRHLRMNYLRPLLMLGLLLSVAGVWIALAFGWQVTAPPLAPGAIFRSSNHNVALHYSVPATNTAKATLEATLQGSKLNLAIDQAARQGLGSATIQARPSYPGIWLTTADGSEQLALPGESKVRAHIGLVFANPGSEESILFPNQAAGLRIVQRANSDGFVLELYRSDADQPVYRAELTPGGQLTIPFAPHELVLLVSALPGLQVDVRHLPGLWLVPLGILLALIGTAAFFRPSAFVVVQVAPWSGEHMVVVAQSDHPNIIAEIQATIAALPPPAASGEGGTSDESASTLPQTTA